MNLAMMQLYLKHLMYQQQILKSLCIEQLHYCL